MSLLGCIESSFNIIHLSGLVLLCVGYFNSSLVSEPVAIFWQLSYLAGQILVDQFLTVYNFTVEIVTAVIFCFKIIYEDSLIFVKDATEKFTFALSLLKEGYLLIENVINVVCSWIWNVLSTTEKAVEGIASFGKFLQFVFVAFKNILLLIGTFIWNFVTSIPQGIVNYCYELNNLIRNTKNEIINSVNLFCIQIYEMIEQLYLFFTEIPLNSIYGLIIAVIVFISLCTKFKDICLVTSSVLLKLYKGAVSFGSNLWAGRYLENKVENVPSSAEDDARVCVICQYQPKEIIIFPCKHLCMCWECSVELLKIQASCPICRSEIQQTLRVYL